jgi:fructan beta-fructosidase
MQGKADTYPWKGQMSIPRDLSLRSTKEGLRLVQQPTSVVTGNRSVLAGQPVMDKKDLSVDNKEISLLPSSGNAYWLKSEWDIAAGAKAGFKIAGKATITYDAATHQLSVASAGHETASIDLTGTTGPLRLEVLVDKSSLEVFVSNGEKVLTSHVYPDAGASGLTAFSTGGHATLHTMQLWDLSKIKQ